MKSLISLLAMLVAVNFCYAQNNSFPTPSGNATIGNGNYLIFTDANVNSTSGITWYSQAPLNYGITRTSGNWTAPNYQQLSINWDAGIIINPGTNQSGKSYLEIAGSGLRVTGGNVGIGTTSPSAKLQMITVSDVNPTNIGSTNFDNRHFAIGTSGVNASALAFSKNTTADGSAYISSATIGLSWDPIGFQAGSYNWYMGGGTTPSMKLTLIGSPDVRLDVNGTIHTKQINVDLIDWPDYVFKPTYHLPSLSEVKTYIDQNQHLPEMPSEQEVAKNGVNLGEMVKLQTKKIEELTLYLIEQNKQLSQEHQAVQSQEQRIQELEQQLKTLLPNHK